jgi:ubiquinone/menaquinone biosynthesis C-methylase UbiE
LEIGAGTGKATIQFAEKGFSIHAIELDKDMAEILKAKCLKYQKVSFDVTPFEGWNSSNDKKFDMIYCAQAFHWIDTSIKYKKCHELLKDEGYLVLFWYNAADSESFETRLINQKTEEIIEKYVDSYFVDKGQPKRSAHSGISNEDEREAEIKASGLFEIIEKIEYTQEKRNNAEQYLKARKSVPAFASILDGLDDEKIEKMGNEIREIVNNYGGYAGTTFSFSLYITKKISD